MEDNKKAWEGPELLEDAKLTKNEQLDLAERLQAMLLRSYLKRLQEGSLSDTGMASLQRLLSQNGWSLDPAQLPQELRHMLTSEVSPEELDEEDLEAGVIPMARYTA